MVMQKMSELYGKTKVPYVTKDVNNFKTTLDEAQSHKDMALLLAHFKESGKYYPKFFYKLHLDHDDIVENIFLHW